MKPATLINPDTEQDEALLVYHSVAEKTEELANSYAETDKLSHRYLAYRDLPPRLRCYIEGNKALDYGTGTGISASFLKSLGFDVIGAEIDLFMLEKAKKDFPDITFVEVDELTPQNQFDLIFSCFVLFDMKSKEAIISYFQKATSFMKNNGIIVAITGSEELYSVNRKWTAFESNYIENKSLRSGDTAKLKLLEPPMEFFDYFWTEEDYLDCFRKANLEVLEIHRALGSEEDPYVWKDEKYYAPFTTYILKLK